MVGTSAIRHFALKAACQDTTPLPTSESLSILSLSDGDHRNAKLRWFFNRYNRHISKMYNGGLYDAPDKLDTLWPLILGGSLFAALDLGLHLQGAVRWTILALLVGPGMMWAGLLLFHEFRSLPGRYRRHKALSDRRE